MSFTKKEQQALYHLLTLQQHIGTLPKLDSKLVLDHISPTTVANLKSKGCFEEDYISTDMTSLQRHYQSLSMLGIENAIPHHALNRFSVPFSEKEWEGLMRSFPNEQCLIAFVRETALNSKLLRNQ